MYMYKYINLWVKGTQYSITAARYRFRSESVLVPFFLLAAQIGSSSHTFHEFIGFWPYLIKIVSSSGCDNSNFLWTAAENMVSTLLNKNMNIKNQPEFINPCTCPLRIWLKGCRIRQPCTILSVGPCTVIYMLNYSNEKKESVTDFNHNMLSMLNKNVNNCQQLTSEGYFTVMLFQKILQGCWIVMLLPLRLHFSSRLLCYRHSVSLVVFYGPFIAICQSENKKNHLTWGVQGLCLLHNTNFKVHVGLHARLLVLFTDVF